ncbi:hypothetical protein HAX54_010534 [Datura stramonium]|uniref:NB-ARC domain-containing protein n=1 Tax=Datura stramonium TaxID=4076 RepID=A0ABS8THZ9_DATST|nr:hypothetical protein [Datura stramonium]
MAAHAAATSLMGTVHLISQSTLDLQEVHKQHLKLLYDKVGSLLEFLDNSDDEPMTDLLKRINDIAQEVEDKVESHIQRESQNTLLNMLPRVLQLPTMANKLLKILRRAVQEIDPVKKELIKLRENNNSNMRDRNCSLICDATYPHESHVSTPENDMVGYNIERERMLDRIRGNSSQLGVISIAGMGGIGKSTFAKRMFSDPLIVSFFDVRGWMTVSKDYSLRKMLISLLQDAIGVNEELHKKSNEELAKTLKINDGETSRSLA